MIYTILSANLNAEKLLIVSKRPDVLDDKSWKNYFRGSSWKNNEILEADRDYLFIYLNYYKIPKNMDWKKPSWGLWDLRSNAFRPLKEISSDLIPIRKIGNRIFLRNNRSTSFYYYDLDIEKSLKKIQSSIKIRGWFPRADGSIAYILESEDCDHFKGPKKGRLWSVCVMNSNFQEIEKVISIEPGFNPMLTGGSDNFIVMWTKNLEEKLWFLGAVNLETGNLKIITKSNLTDITKLTPPKWLSWLENDWVVYEAIQQLENNTPDSSDKKEKNKSFILYNISNEQRRKILLDEESMLLMEIGNYKRRNFSYNPYLIILDREDTKNRIKVIDVGELRVLLEEYYPFDHNKEILRSVFYP